MHTPLRAGCMQQGAACLHGRWLYIALHASLSYRREMATQVQYQYLEPRPRSHYRQLWVKGRHLRAEVLYRYTVGVEPRTPEAVTQ